MLHSLFGAYATIERFEIEDHIKRSLYEEMTRLIPLEFKTHYDAYAIYFLDLNQEIALDFKTITQGSKEALDATVRRPSFNPFAYLNGQHDLMTHIQESNRTPEEREQHKQIIRNQQARWVKAQADRCVTLHLLDLPLAPPSDISLQTELDALLEEAPLNMIIAGLPPTYIKHFSKLLQWLKSKGFDDAATRLAHNDSDGVRSAEHFPRLVSQLHDFCAELCINAVALAPDSDFRRESFVGLSHCAEGIQNTLLELRTMAAATGSAHAHLTLQSALNDIHKGIVLPLIPQFKIREGNESHIDQAKALAYMGILPGDAHHRDRYRLSFSEAYSRSIAGAMLHAFYLVLAERRHALINLCAMSVLPFHADAIPHLNRVEKELKEAGCLKPEATLAETLHLLSGQTVERCQFWLDKIIDLEESSTLNEQETVFIILLNHITDHTLLAPLLNDFFNRENALKSTLAVDKITKVLDGTEIRPFAFELNNTQAIAAIQRHFAQFIKPGQEEIESLIQRFLTDPSESSDADKNAWRQLLDAPDGLYKIRDSVISLPADTPILPQRVLYWTASEKSLFTTAAADPLFAEWWLGIKYNLSAPDHIERNTPSRLFNTLAGIPAASITNLQYQAQLEHLLHTPGAVNYYFGHLILTEETALIHPLRDQFSDNAFYSYACFADVLKDMMRHSARRSVTESFLKNHLQKQTQYKRFSDSVQTLACFPNRRLNEPVWEYLLNGYAPLSDWDKPTLKAMYHLIMANASTPPPSVIAFFQALASSPHLDPECTILLNGINALCALYCNPEWLKTASFFMDLFRLWAEAEEAPQLKKMIGISPILILFFTADDYAITTMSLEQTLDYLIILSRLNPFFNVRIQPVLGTLRVSDLRSHSLFALGCRHDFEQLTRLINQNLHLFQVAILGMIDFINTPEHTPRMKENALKALLSLTPPNHIKSMGETPGIFKSLLAITEAETSSLSMKEYAMHTLAKLSADAHNTLKIKAESAMIRLEAIINRLPYSSMLTQYCLCTLSNLMVLLRNREDAEEITLTCLTLLKAINAPDLILNLKYITCLALLHFTSIAPDRLKIKAIPGIFTSLFSIQSTESNLPKIKSSAATLFSSLASNPENTAFLWSDLRTIITAPDPTDTIKIQALASLMKGFQCEEQKHHLAAIPDFFPSLFAILFAPESSDMLKKETLLTLSNFSSPLGTLTPYQAQMGAIPNVFLKLQAIVHTTTYPADLRSEADKLIWELNNHPENTVWAGLALLNISTLAESSVDAKTNALKQLSLLIHNAAFQKKLSTIPDLFSSLFHILFSPLSEYSEAQKKHALTALHYFSTWGEYQIQMSTIPHVFKNLASISTILEPCYPYNPCAPCLPYHGPDHRGEKAAEILFSLEYYRVNRLSSTLFFSPTTTSLSTRIMTTLNAYNEHDFLSDELRTLCQSEPPNERAIMARIEFIFIITKNYIILKNKESPELAKRINMYFQIIDHIQNESKGRADYAPRYG